ncbi:MULTISPECIES: CaiB/BaiF CoA transferase family protein [Nonomuraea]|uniref:CaiB/BaiF CoA-transferase family protein n=1 Tax=Nonomuraea ferruginea TaxID=46174 RepID=A0ABT4T041_9ACTN|nr:CaiB/BaiF CoA-transferase family protein [Nonomuraea ferruginea]MDA0642416.1 CaiB/BaiF CoA-transferase family protein [Nonomuraea ferruginea]
MSGPLHGVRVVELGGQGPVPFCAMTLADLGAEVVTLRRPGPAAPTNPHNPVIDRGRRFLAVDLKSPDGVAVAKRLAGRADAVLEGFRPGVLERLGLGPADCLAVNPRLVYGRMTGWGQDGPLAQTAGHDINYIALTGALHGIGTAGGPPVPPINLVGDYAGGALYLALGVTSALLSARATGRGQVVDAAIVDGVAALMSIVYGLTAAGRWTGERGANLLDGGAPFYRVYRCADGGHVAVGALEEPFYLDLLDGLGLAGRADLVDGRLERSRWPAIAEALSAAFGEHPRAHWEAVFGGRDACVTPVLSAQEATRHEHLAARGTYVDGHAAPAPRFSGTPATSAPHAEPARSDVRALLAEHDLSPTEIDRLLASGAVGPASW